MTRNRTRRTTALAFDAITVEGALIAPAMMARIAQHQAGGQAEADYSVPKGLTLRDEIARYFRISQALFAELMRARRRPTLPRSPARWRLPLLASGTLLRRGRMRLLGWRYVHYVPPPPH